MASRPIAKGNISFGLVSIPVKLFSATRPQSVSFNLLHEKDKSRIQQKIYCPVDDAIVDRSELVRGFEIEKGRYVTFTDEELKNLEAASGDPTIEITEFLPLREVDPVYFESSYYLESEQGAGRAYRLLTDAMTSSERVALGRYTMRGKEHLVVLRPYAKGLMLHTLYYADEVKAADEFDRSANESSKENELALAKRLIDDLTHKKFEPEHYHDSYRERVVEAAQQKAAGEQIAAAPASPHRGQVIDLMAALKASLDKRGTKVEPAAAESEVDSSEKVAVNAHGKTRPSAAASHAKARRVARKK
ncbi:MAG TPA: Ku protein [Candidatus Binataceae bacterium]